jgi:ABC-type transport system substrate-binding protein
MKKAMNRVGLASFILAAAAFTFSGCTHKNAEDEKLNVITVGLRSDVKTLDPANAYDSVSNDVGPNIYESLYQYSYLTDGVEVEPLLAADMPKYSKDRLTVTIPIKHGIKFQDNPCFKATSGKGREVTAEDFIYQMKRLAIPQLDSQLWWALDGRIAGINAFHDKLVAAKTKQEAANIFAEPVEGLKALDPYTLQVTFTKPYPQFKYILTMGATAAVPHEAVEMYGDEKGNLTDNAVGSGPFMFQKWDRNRQIVLVRNPNYHPDFYPTKAANDWQQKGMLADAGKTMPFVDKIVYSISEEQQPAWLNFLKGSQDSFQLQKDFFKQSIVNRTNLTPEFAAKGMRLTIETGVAFYQVEFNMEDKLLGSNKYLRQALSSAINRDEWIDVFTYGTGQKQVTALPPGIADRPNDSKIKYDYDLARAKELLKKAGYPDGKGLPVLKFDLRGAGTADRQLGEFFKTQWGKIGVQIDVNENTFPTFLEKAKKKNLQIFYGGWNMDYPDAENVYQLLYSKNESPGPNDANYKNPEFDKLYEQLAGMESGPKRAAIVKKADDMIQEDCPWAMGYYYARYDLSQPWLLNYRSGDIVQNRFKYFRLDKEVKKRYQNQR